MSISLARGSESAYLPPEVVLPGTPTRAWKHRFFPVLVVVVATCLSLASFVYYYNQGLTLQYADAKARLLITRRVVDSPTPGFAQLGSVWLPLTHILSLPMIGNDFLYQSGLAGSAPSLISYVLCAFFIYETLVLLTGKKGAGLVGAFIFAANPNVLYMQATPMTEMPMIMTMMAAVYCLLRLTREPTNRTWYFWSGVAIAASTLIRYEGWALLPVEILVMLYVFFRRRFGLHKIEGLLLFWSYIAFAGIAAWLLWNWMIFGDPLSFQRGEYAKPALWISANDIVIGHLNIAALTYYYATLLTVGPIIFVSLIGVAYFLFRTRLNQNSVAPLALFCMVPFFVLMLYLGQRPLKVPEFGGMYNIRFALVMILPTAIFVGYMAQRRLTQVLILLIAVGSTLLMLKPHGLITVEEPKAFVTSKPTNFQEDAGAWLRVNYDGRWMLCQGFGNDQLQFTSGMHLGKVIYEGSYKIWEQALNNPQGFVDWVVMRTDWLDSSHTLYSGDKVWDALHTRFTLYQDYELVFHNELYQILRRRSHPAQIAAF